MRCPEASSPIFIGVYLVLSSIVSVIYTGIPVNVNLERLLFLSMYFGWSWVKQANGTNILTGRSRTCHVINK